MKIHVLYADYDFDGIEIRLVTTDEKRVNDFITAYDSDTPLGHDIWENEELVESRILRFVK